MLDEERPLRTAATTHDGDNGDSDFPDDEVLGLLAPSDWWSYSNMYWGADVGRDRDACGVISV